MQAILDRLKVGRAVLVFPEGERTGDGDMHSFRPGISLLVKRVQAPIVPIGIAGAFQAWPRDRKWLGFAPLFLPASPKTIAVSVGPARSSAEVTGLPREQMLGLLLADVDRQHKRAEKLRRK
jgi:1-acyl-sn-glycerol-3-phosphate acyltransferase